MKVLRDKIKRQYEELGWGDDMQDKYQDRKLIQAYTLEELAQLHSDLVEELANS